MTALAGCSSNASSPSASPETPSQTPTVTSTLDRWNEAYAYLNAQTKPTEIACNWFSFSAGEYSPEPRPAHFYDFGNAAAWKDHVVTRDDTPPKRPFEMCQATVPTSVPYGPAIRRFLGRFGLSFVADPERAAEFTPIEIAYAGANAEDPDIIYRDKPGLFGLRLALAQLGEDAFEPGTSTIIQPTDDETAMRYLTYAAPLLEWYGYEE